MKYSDAIRSIRETLSGRTPQRLSIPGFIPAAVIIPVFEIDREAHLLLTVRTDRVMHHKGQVSFPGGAWEEQDVSLEQTALREAFEEVGIPPEAVAIIGQLDDFPTITDFMVTPYVAAIPYPYPHRLNTDEVAEVLEVPLDLFLSDRAFEIKEKTYRGVTYPVYYYYFEHAVIWGVTGFIVNRFVELVFGFNPAPKSILGDPRTLDYLKDNIRQRGTRKP